ncbi:hypothetical protein GCM10023322_04230 [Rugosimonospora acidiphila]|uniref:Uncharacterized protein n=1 Tax=Rugosimonospora acidiphila TaxID=556531 RepID=A0ABP9RJE9_9ACTN
MNRRRLRSGTLRLIVMAAVALGIIIAAAPTGRVAAPASDDSPQAVVVSVVGSTPGSPLLGGMHEMSPADVIWV